MNLMNTSFIIIIIIFIPHYERNELEKNSIGQINYGKVNLICEIFSAE